MSHELSNKTNRTAAKYCVNFSLDIDIQDDPEATPVAEISDSGESYEIPKEAEAIIIDEPVTSNSDPLEVQPYAIVEEEPYAVVEAQPFAAPVEPVKPIFEPLASNNSQSSNPKKKKMKKCSQCGDLCEKKQKFCPNCGAKL